MKEVFIVHHHEITLKGENRSYFERQLLRNIRSSIADFLPGDNVKGGYGRFLIELDIDSQRDEILNRVMRVFGLSNICVGVKVEQDLQTFCSAAEALLIDKSFKTIKIDTRRPDKRFSVRSMEVNRRVGEYVCRRFEVRADMTNPDEVVYIEIVDGSAYIYLTKLPGLGGLPVGTSGKLVSLLSAGFDSPVASWMMMRRGAIVHAVHFHSMPYTGMESVDQVRQLAQCLAQYQMGMKVYLVPFAPVQQEIVQRSPQPLRVILYRRMMLRIAEAIAKKEKAEGIVTGESVGQVASQTLRNIRAINEVASLPVYRPLAGTDKEEIIALARKIGTHDISSEPFDDCCSFLAPRSPETWADIEQVHQAEGHLDVPGLIADTLSHAEKEQFVYPASMRQEILHE
jgi:thiamine biosynthesis protein ThiI